MSTSSWIWGSTATMSSCCISGLKSCWPRVSATFWRRLTGSASPSTTQRKSNATRFAPGGWVLGPNSAFIPNRSQLSMLPLSRLQRTWNGPGKYSLRQQRRMARLSLSTAVWSIGPSSLRLRKFLLNRSGACLSRPDISGAFKIMQQFEMYINGESVSASSGEWLDTENPSTGEAWARIAKGNAADVNRAVEAAHAAFSTGPWAQMTPSQRGLLLHRVGDLIARDAN